MTIVKKRDKAGSTELEIMLDTRKNDTVLLIYSIETDMGLQNFTVFIGIFHCVKSARIQSFSGPYFPVFGLNTERYIVSLCIQSECTGQKNSECGYFLRSVSDPVKYLLWNIL